MPLPPPRHRPSLIPAGGAPRSAHGLRRILSPGRNSTPLLTVDESGLLIDGRDYYRAFFRAACGARRHLAIAGWQFDSNVCLLRGEEAERARREVRFLPFLNDLCTENPKLEIYLLAWDFSLLFALEREWMQEWIFNLRAHPRIHFRFDSSHALGASHHQKFVVVDGELAFLGGMDICCSRWDQRTHPSTSPERAEEGKTHGPYHDVQSFVRGPAAASLARFFEERWGASGAAPIALTPTRQTPSSDSASPPEVTPTLALRAREVAFSRTLTVSTPTGMGGAAPIHEIQSLYEDAIDAAESFIYLENQYFTSRAVYQALFRRMAARSRPSINIAMVLPVKPGALKEEWAHGIAQARLLHSLQRAAGRFGHAIGIYYTAGTAEDGTKLPTYIHSKLMIVDDRFLTVGSANTTNRSMGLDSELNASWESPSAWPWSHLRRSIRAARLNLLAEHAGLAQSEADTRLRRGKTLVAALDALADAENGRLRRHPLETVLDRSPLLRSVAPDALIWDPSKPLEEDLHQWLAPEGASGFAQGDAQLRRRVEANRMANAVLRGTPESP